MEKEFIVSIPGREASQVLDIIQGVMESTEEKDVPEKFKNALRGLTFGFQTKDHYKMNDAHLRGFLDVIGGFYCMADKAKERHYDGADEMYPVALSLIRLARKVEKEAVKQGFNATTETETPTPPTDGKYLH